MKLNYQKISIAFIAFLLIVSGALSVNNYSAQAAQGDSVKLGTVVKRTLDADGMDYFQFTSTKKQTMKLSFKDAGKKAIGLAVVKGLTAKQIEQLEQETMSDAEFEKLLDEVKVVALIDNMKGEDSIGQHTAYVGLQKGTYFVMAIGEAAEVKKYGNAYSVSLAKSTKNTLNMNQMIHVQKQQQCSVAKCTKGHLHSYLTMSIIIKCKCQQQVNWY